MYASLDLFRMSHAMATHAGKRQAVVATNMANADTPGYRARDIAEFAAVLEDGSPGSMRATRGHHLHGGVRAMEARPFVVPNAEASPNGNTVSLEEEMLKAVEVQRQHSKAIAIYRSGLSILRASLGRR